MALTRRQLGVVLLGIAMFLFLILLFIAIFFPQLLDIYCYVNGTIPCVKSSGTNVHVAIAFISLFEFQIA